MRKLTSCSTFQWGHNLSVMDTIGGSVVHSKGLFQWGHNLSVMDTCFSPIMLLL